MSVIARTGTTWELVTRNLLVSRAILDDQMDDALVLYSLTHNGADFGSGVMTWEAFGYENAWVARFALPETPGILVAEVLATATIDGDGVMGRLQTSVNVI